MSKFPEDSFHPGTRQELRAWLEKNHENQAGIWLVINKKTTGQEVTPYDDALEEYHSLLWIAPRNRAQIGRVKTRKESKNFWGWAY